MGDTGRESASAGLHGGAEPAATLDEARPEGAPRVGEETSPLPRTGRGRGLGRENRDSGGSGEHVEQCFEHARVVLEQGPQLLIEHW